MLKFMTHEYDAIILRTGRYLLQYKIVPIYISGGEKKSVLHFKNKKDESHDC